MPLSSPSDNDAWLVPAERPGGTGSAEELFALLYAELHALAARQIRSRGGATTLGTTTLLHETYLSLADRDGLAFADRSRFLAYAARAMRGLIVDYARRGRAVKRGSEFRLVSLDADAAVPAEPGGAHLERLGAALELLSASQPELAALVDLHFFGGFSLVEIAELRHVSERTVQRDWRKARLLLAHLLDPAGPAPG